MLTSPAQAEPRNLQLHTINLAYTQDITLTVTLVPTSTLFQSNISFFCMYECNITVQLHMDCGQEK